MTIALADAPPLVLDRLETPIGTMLLLVDERDRLCALDWDDYEERFHRLLRRFGGRRVIAGGTVPALREALQRYFAGEIGAIDTIAVRPLGGTPFQQRVWEGLRTIPAGRTESYGAFARRLGVEQAVRAVGMANGANPIGVVVPCHRVIGANGTLTGYGGGLKRKAWLLAHEGAWPGQRQATLL